MTPQGLAAGAQRYVDGARGAETVEERAVLGGELLA